jgi:hypothetical protein
VLGTHGPQLVTLLSSAVLLVTSTTSSVQAEPRPAGQARPVELTFARGAGAAACPDVEALRQAVVKELKYDPFVSSTASPPSAAGVTQRLKVSIDRREGELAVDIELRDGAGHLLWDVRDRRSRSDCHTLVDTLGLSIAIRLDPEPESPACPVCAPPPPQAAPGGPPEEHPEPARPRVLLGGGPLLGFTLFFVVSPGFSLFAGARWTHFSLAAEGRAFLIGRGEQESGTHFEITSYSGIVTPCAHLALVFGCGVVELGALRFDGAVSSKAVSPSFFANVGIRAGVELPLSEHFRMRGYADVLGSIAPATSPVSTGTMSVPLGRMPALLGVAAVAAF